MISVLIADDEELERKSLRIFLNRNYEDITVLPDAENGPQVIEQVSRYEPDLLILDIEMPGLTGLEALRLLRRDHPSLHVIVKTAYGNFTYAQDALNMQVDAYLLKPVKKAELTTHLNQIIEKINLERAQISRDENSHAILEELRPLAQLSFMSALLRNMASPDTISRYTDRFTINFKSGFVATLRFSDGILCTENRISADAPDSSGSSLSSSINLTKEDQLLQELHSRLSLSFDYMIGPFEKNVLPILFYSGKLLSAHDCDRWKQDLTELFTGVLRPLCPALPIISFGPLFRDDITQAAHSYQCTLQELMQQTPPSPLPEPGQGINTHLKKALDFIEEHYSENISLESVADYIKMNPSYLSRLFKNELDKNFIGYLTDIRMTHAIRLIHQGTDNVKELSARVGYLYPSYFCKQFKKYTGHTVSDLNG